jgi:hypothetical protein
MLKYENKDQQGNKLNPTKDKNKDQKAKATFT